MLYIHAHIDAAQMCLGVTEDTLPCVFAVKLPAEGQKGQMVRFKGPAGSELSVKGALSTFIGDVLEGKIAAHR